MLREAGLLRSQHGYAFLKIVCCSPFKSGTDPRTGLALFGHRPKDRSRVVSRHRRKDRACVCFDRQSSVALRSASYAWLQAFLHWNSVFQSNF